MYELFYGLFIVFILGLAYYKILRPMGIRIPGLPQFGKGRSGKPGEVGLCPYCKSSDIFYSAQRGIYYCSKCTDGGRGFTEPIKPDRLTREPGKLPTLSEEELKGLLVYVPDEFLPQATAFLKGTNPDRVWLELFSYKYPKWYRNFMNLFMSVTSKAKQ